jgi:hypothetical protein
LPFELRVEVVVLIPTAVHELDEASAALDEAAGDQAMTGISSRFVNLRAIGLDNFLRLVLEVQ